MCSSLGRATVVCSSLGATVVCSSLGVYSSVFFVGGLQ